MKNIINLIKTKYNVKIIYKKHLNNIAEYDDNNKTIIVNTEYKKNMNVLIPILFHELGHKYCFEKKIFYHYHIETNLRLIKLTGLRAERYVDRWAKKEMEKLNIKIIYPMFYYQKDRTKNFKNYISKQIKK
jgi:hypothetical protein